MKSYQYSYPTICFESFFAATMLLIEFGFAALKGKDRLKTIFLVFNQNKLLNLLKMLTLNT